MDIANPTTALLKTSRELGVAIVAYSPLGRGFLTSQYKFPADFEEGDVRIHWPCFSAENFTNNLRLVGRLVEIAVRKGCTTAQGEDIIPIPRTKKIKYLEENLGALHVELTDEENFEIRRAIEEAKISGIGTQPHTWRTVLWMLPSRSKGQDREPPVAQRDGAVRRDD